MKNDNRNVKLVKYFSSCYAFDNKDNFNIFINH